MLDISRHFIIEKIANSTLQDEQLSDYTFTQILLEFDNHHILLLSEEPSAAVLIKQVETTITFL